MRRTFEYMKNCFFILLLLFSAPSANAQFRQAVIGIDGLTCSACSFGTQKSIMRLDFVDSVKMDLNKNIATITFKPGKKVSIDAIVQKVYDAGFSVRSVHAVYEFTDMKAVNDAFFNFEDNAYEFIGLSGERTLNGPVDLTFINEKYISKKEMKKWKDLIAKAKPCTLGKQKPYYVTL